MKNKKIIYAEAQRTESGGFGGRSEYVPFRQESLQQKS
jgi:hypothetical protein